MWERIDSQEVGLEAATFQRKRNSSLVEWACAENVTGLKSNTEASGCILIRLYTAVGERRSGNEG
jgi:hypothetical protein